MGSRFARATIALALAAACVLPSCGGGGGGGGGGVNVVFDRQGLLTNLADNLVLGTYTDLLAKLQTLETEVGEWAADIGNATKLTEAQDAWKAAMDVLQIAEFLQFGPAGRAGEIYAGADYRDEIYSWPTFSVCLVDDELVENPFVTDLGSFTARTINSKGLAAVEYVLFYVAPDGTCGQATDAQRRATYAAGAAAYSRARAQELATAWSAVGGNFVGTFKTAATSGVYPSAHAAVNDVFGAMFYLDSVVKDKKLSLPAGISGTLGVRPDFCEAPRSLYSKENVLTNLLTFEKIFLGPGAPGALGFDDFLIAAGQTALATQMATDITEAIAAVNAIPGDIETAVADPMTGHPAVVAAHAAIRDITTTLKTTFVSALGLTVPATGSGDTD